MDEPPDPIGKIVANLLLNDIKGLLNKHKLTIEQCPISPAVLALLARFIRMRHYQKEQ